MAIINLGSGNDNRSGTTLADIILGGLGNDTLNGLDGNDLLLGSLGDDSLDGGVGDDTLAGGADNDRLFGSTGLDVLLGDDGNDYLDGGLGNDTMDGGFGNDTYIVDSLGDVAAEVAGGIDLVIASVNHTLSVNIENLTLSGASNLNGTGNSKANTITGNNGNNSLVGLGGNDTLSGNSGNDFLDGGTGDDNLNGGLGNDTYVVDSLGDVAAEVAGGIDLVLSSVSHTLSTNLENLTLTGTAANGAGNAKGNTINGNASNNLLSGLSGDDVLSGGSGNDTLVGGTGADTLTGGSGFDRFRFSQPTEGVDQITDFSTAFDTIEVSRLGFGAGLNLGTISEAQFSTNGAGLTAATRFIYFTGTGNLYFDSNGSGVGGRTRFAQLDANLALTRFDIQVVA